MNDNGDRDLLRARAADFVSALGDGVLSAGHFLSTAGQNDVRAAVSSLGFSRNLVFYGGYGGAERRRWLVVPDWYLPVGGETLPGAIVSDYPETDISYLLLSGSGYRKLSHRDWLGSVMSLGMDRDRIGDIVVLNDYSAGVVCETGAAAFICSELKSAGKDTVKASETEYGKFVLLLPERKTEPISDTVVSPRADAVVSALCRVSREKAKTLIASAMVRVNEEETLKPEKEICDGDVISVRGTGKFKVLSVSETNRSGRRRLYAEKYI